MPDNYTALAVAIRTDMATLIPRRPAALSAQGGRVKLVEPPYDSPPVDIGIVYLKDRLADPAIAWLRDQIRAVSATL